ncbi:MAG: hypothetical protein AAFR53_12035 [Pseudomonadota bacterium]
MLDTLRQNLPHQTFRVKYRIESVVYVGASADDLDAFLKSDYPKGDGTEEDLERHFWSWVVAEEGYEFDEREAPEILDLGVIADLRG